MRSTVNEAGGGSAPFGAYQKIRCSSSPSSRKVGATVEKATALDANGQKIGLSMPWWFWNFFGQQAVFLLRR